MIKSILRRCTFSIQFLTTIPIRINLNLTDKDIGKSLVFAPVSGMVIGLILYFFYKFANILIPGQLTSISIIAFYCWLTGALHIDGLGDTFDGIFSSRTKDKILLIMKDSRLGTNGLLAIFFILTFNIVLVNEITKFNEFVLILFPVAGRMSILICASISKYVDGKEGLGSAFVKNCNLKEMIIGVTIGGIVFLFFDLVYAVLFLATTIFLAVLLTKYFSRKLGGVTGDIIGCVCELSQTLLLLSAFVIYNV